MVLLWEGVVLKNFGGCQKPDMEALLSILAQGSGCTDGSEAK